ncbi:MAG: sugar transferase [Clostridia bacterium]|nr:sugar transferase [Clostridia bacterium]
MQIKGKYSWIKHLDFMIVDLLALILSFIIAYLFKFGNISFFHSKTWTRLLILVCLFNIIITLFFNPYSGIFRRSYYMEFVRALQLSVINLLLVSLVFYFFKIGEDYSRSVFFMMYGLYFLLSIVMKYIWKKLIVSRKIVLYITKEIPLFVVGDRESIETIIANVSSGDFKLYDIKGVYLIDDYFSDDVDGITVVHSDFVGYVTKNNISDVLISVQPSKIASEDYNKLTSNGVNIHINVESAVGFQTEDQFIANLGVYKTLSIGAFSFTPRQMIYLTCKRLFDIICGLFGLLVLIPITIAVKIATLASGDTAKIFYTQKRVGLNGKIIKILKFRSMVPNAGEILEEMLKDEKYRKEWEENQKFENDPRVTKVGKILRKTSIDELPQLINVLKGDMSLVGPRPLVVGELEAHDGLKLYNRVKPGITGWWGCNGRSNIDYRERLELEYYYVKNCSFYLDLLCVFRTALAVLKRDGAK